MITDKCWGSILRLGVPFARPQYPLSPFDQDMRAHVDALCENMCDECDDGAEKDDTMIEIKRQWDDRVLIDHVPGVGSRFTTVEPCDDRDDGFNKASSEPQMYYERVQTSRDGTYRVIARAGGVGTINLSYIHGRPDFYGITYRLGDTTTFSAGPYDESLGTPVTVHFRKV